MSIGQTGCLAGTALALTLALAAAPANAQVRERAPGVPAAPQPSELDRPVPADGGAGQRPGTALDARRDAPGKPEPTRDPPMPKPVPSIIQN